jgi:hypothetical protein
MMTDEEQPHRGAMSASRPPPKLSTGAAGIENVVGGRAVMQLGRQGGISFFFKY